MTEGSEADGITITQTAAGQIRTRLEGRGSQTVVFIPDAPAMLEHHEGLFNARPDDLKFMSIEPVGTGFSIPNDEFDFTFDQYTSALIEALDRAHVSKAVFAVGCVNAYFALLLTKKRPDLVDQLILWQAPSWKQELRFVHKSIDPHEALRQPDGPAKYEQMKYMASKRWFEISGGPHGDAEDMTKRTHQVFDNGGCQCLAQLVGSMFYNPEPSFEPLQTKTTILWCGADNTHRNSTPESLLKLVPNSQIVRWEDAGHLPEVEFPKRMVKLISSNLAQNIN
ncbi:MAG: pimeloyl-ACP methyl ester carboxylesterase [Ascidiaceihabitans sp.]